MTDCPNTQLCQQNFETIHEKLDRLDEAVRGNGKPGIQLRLDRIEQNAKRISRLVWLTLGGFATAATSALVAWIVR